MTVREIAEKTGVSQSAVRANLEGMSPPYATYKPLVERLGESVSGAKCWGLTETGKSSAKTRSQRMMHLRSTRRPA